MIKPLGSRVLLKEYKVETSSGGIELISSSQEKKIREVVSVGPDVKTVKVGDKVISGEFSGNSFMSEGKLNIIVNEIDIIAVVED